MLRRSWTVFSRKFTSSAAPVSSALNQVLTKDTAGASCSSSSSLASPSANTSAKPPSRRVFVSNLPWEMQWHELKEVMMLAGQVEHAAIFRDATGRSRGFGLVQFQTHEEAANAVQLFHDKSVSGRVLSVRADEKPEERSVFAVVTQSESYLRHRAEEERMERHLNKPNQAEKERYQIYVGNLPYNATWHQIRDLFLRAGNVTFVRVLKHPDGRPRGIGFVRFTSPDAVTRAVELFDGEDFMGRTLHVKARATEESSHAQQPTNLNPDQDQSWHLQDENQTHAEETTERPPGY